MLLHDVGYHIPGTIASLDWWVRESLDRSNGA